MSNYRRGAIFGLTVAEMFILLTFILLIALLGLNQSEESDPQADTETSARVWVRPEEIQTLVNAAEEAQKKAELAHAAVERERDLAQRTVEEVRKAQEVAELARASAEEERDQAREKAEEAQKKAELAHAAVERERDLAQRTVEEVRKAQEVAELARASAEEERDQGREKTEEAQKKAELAHAAVERERDLALRDLILLRHKGENPPCWYEVVNAGEGKTRERRLYAFKVAIYEDGIELGQLTPPPGGAVDDSSDTYADEWVQLQVGELPYGERLDDDEFEDAVRHLHEKGKNRQVRTYECVFSVRVWDETPDHAKERWQYAHDELIEQFFNAYTMKELKWEDVE